MTLTHRLLFDLRKAQQLGLFGAAPPPAKPREREEPSRAAAPPPTPAPKPAAPVGDKPSGAGWMPIPGSRHGGYHRQKPGGGYEYWYPGEGVRETARDLGDSFQLQPQAAGKPKDKSGRQVHHDVGEKIGGARKDKYATVHAGNLGALEAEGEGEAYKHVTKDKVFRKWDPEHDRAIGDTPGASRLKQFILGTVGSRPTLDPKSKARGVTEANVRSWYVHGAEWLAEALDQVHTVEQVSNFLDEWRWLAQHGDYTREEPVTPEKARELAAKYPGGRGSTVYVRSGEVEPVTYGTHTMMRPKTIGLDADALKRAGYSIKQGADGEMLRSMAPQSRNFAGFALAMGERTAGLIGYGKRTDAFINARSDAREREKTGNWDGLGVSKRAEGGAPKLNPHELIGMRRGKMERVGGAELPARVDGAKLAAEFGLRAVEYGNWIDDDQASAHLEHCYGALLDLADILGVDPKQIANGNKLALAFGARGSGWANAHYESDKAIINLTATRGGGTLAHEWGHFFDHFLGGGGHHVEEMKYVADFITHGKHEHLPEHMQDAAEELMGAILGGVDLDKRSRELKRQRTKMLKEGRYLRRGTPELADFQKRLDKLMADIREHNTAIRATRGGAPPPKSTKFARDAGILGDYWERKHELFARAFESWAEDKLHERGQKNTYLVTGTRDPFKLSKVQNGHTFNDLEIYPQGEERKAINAAIDNFMAAVRSTGSLKKALQASLGLRSLPRGLRPLPAGARVLRPTVAG